MPVHPSCVHHQKLFGENARKRDSFVSKLVQIQLPPCINEEQILYLNVVPISSAKKKKKKMIQKLQIQSVLDG